MTASVWFVLAIILVALTFDFINGFHDSANSIATVVSTRVLSPRFAVVWAAFFNFVAAFGFGTAVAKTIGSGLIDISIVDPLVILGGLSGAIAWDLITWYVGIPSSSSHALIGGYGGAAVAKAGVSALILGGWVKPVLFILLSPVIGMAAGMALMTATAWSFRRASPRMVDKYFRALQLVSSAAFSLSHGTNDAQKTMGIVVGLLVASQALFQDFPVRAFYLTSPSEIPRWVILSAHAAIAAGTLAGGWRIVKTMGSRLTKLKPVHGFCAETAGAGAIFAATALGVPVSTTHTITGSIVGVGSVQRFSAVRWGLAGRIVWAWILTIPASAGIAGIGYLVLHALLR
ncbi:MAG: inorganic phosphate transporter [Betaproteobacteria bacterium RIFCSPLOWO2_12_FULL_66_14]|nr:MAG: inorganic phosphate transporter [Betaproteobacteria bacterium RIFCSPLOWO2_12_FULL_66_14]